MLTFFHQLTFIYQKFLKIHIRSNKLELDYMRRGFTPKKNLDKESEKMKMFPASQIMGFLSGVSSEYTPFEISTSKFNISKTEVIRSKDFFTITRPHTSSKTNEFEQSKNKILVANNRKQLRPRSSTMNIHHKLIESIHESQKQGEFVVNSYRQPKCDSTRNESIKNYISLPHRENEFKIDYKLVQADELFEKTLNKPPQAIRSTKMINHVRAYAVNSHKFHIEHQISEARILIIANITKTAKVQAITSLYALFQSTKSASYLDFMRQQFQMEIGKKLEGFPIPQITKEVIQACIHKIDNKFCSMYNVPTKKSFSLPYNITNSFGLSYNMVFVRNEEIVICTKGSLFCKLSMNYGGKLQSQNFANSIFLRKIKKQEIGSLDFIALISEGLQSYKKEVNSSDSELNNNYIFKQKDEKKIMNESGWVQRQVWQILLNFIMQKNDMKGEEKRYNTIHQIVGGTIDSLFSVVSSTHSQKNFSIILLLFKNVEKIVSQDSNLEIPYCEEEKKISGMKSEGERDALPVDNLS